MATKTTKQSGGLLLYRTTSSGAAEVLLVHPGGPFWAKKDLGAWSIPKGEFADDEQPLDAAKREFTEETGLSLPDVHWLPLGSLKQPSGKTVHAWAADCNLDLVGIKFGTFTMEWPPKSGKQADFPEIDKAEWFDLSTARTKILQGQAAFLDGLVKEAQLTERASSASTDAVQGQLFD